MDSGIVNIKGRDYQTVALRVQKFRESHPIESGWRIVTSPHHIDNDVVVMVAQIISPEGHTVATGHAEELRSASQINSTSALENCETSAIGRALAAAGLGGTEYATANEVANAIHQQHGRRTPEQTAQQVAAQVPGVKVGAHEPPPASAECAEFMSEVRKEVEALDPAIREAHFTSPNDVKNKVIRLLLKKKIFASADEMASCTDRGRFEAAAAEWFDYIDHNVATPF